ncbi:MAG: (Fe-S)-binding protein [Thermoplasmata archaeon]|nr:MAG: (Fe-S)-binding protein [Thermoplasmata archaeon]
MTEKDLDSLEKEMLVCTQCGYCRSVCPIFEDLGWDSSVARGRVILAYGMLKDRFDIDDSIVETLYECSTCGDCERRCPSNVCVVDIIEAARKELFEDYALEKHKKLADRINEFGNPYGETTKRGEEFGKTPHKAKVGYFLGCTPGYRNPNIAKTAMSILDKLGVDYTVIDEVCCGSPLQRIGGNDEDIKKLVDHNLNSVEELGIETLIFSCAGCYNMFKNHYPEFRDLKFKPMHITEFLAEQDLPLKEFPKTLTYHDPCHLGRHAKVYDAPRKIIKKIPKAQFKEMDLNRELARCCGGGGGLRAAFGDISQRIAGRRVSDAEFADLLLTSCPFCVNNLAFGKELSKSEIEVKDIVELVDELL